jgi:hypothetical protein
MHRAAEEFSPCAGHLVAMKHMLSYLVLTLGLAAGIPALAHARPMPAGAEAFAGNWCAAGNPGKGERIEAKGPVEVEFKNWDGATGPGTVAGRTIVATNDGGLTGTLSGDGQTIHWSNKTYWKRCNTIVP